MLTVKNLSLEIQTSDGSLSILDHVSFSIDSGETYALVGESGCGKSMTALALMRLTPPNAVVTEGEILCDNESLLDLSEAQMVKRRGSRLAMIFQEPSTSLNPVLTVGEQIEEVLKIHGENNKARLREEAVQWLERVGIDDPSRRYKAYPFELSGGQKQRVMIAMALAGKPDLLIADEPTTALDVTLQAQILDLLQDLQRTQKVALLLITHDLALVRRYANRVGLMYGGQIVEEATCDAFFSNPMHPYARGLIKAVPSVGKREVLLQGIPGVVGRFRSDYAGCRFKERCVHASSFCEQEIRWFGAENGHRVRCCQGSPFVRNGQWRNEEKGSYYYDGEISGSKTLKGTSETAFSIPNGEQASSVPLATRGLAKNISSVVDENGEPLIAYDDINDVRSTRSNETITKSEEQKEVVVSVKDISGFSLVMALENVSVTYEASDGFLTKKVFRAVDRVSLRLRAAETLALVGESGSGKTTLAKAMLGLLDDVAKVSGAIRLGSYELGSSSRQRLRAVRRYAQIVFQDPFSSLNPRMTIGECLQEGMLSLTDMTAQEREERVLELLTLVGLPESSVDRLPHEFSGGQRQRIAIARALAVSPRIIVCDEPTSALDVSVQASVLNLMRDIQKKTGVAYLFITHNFGVVEYIADTVAVMRHGRLIEYGNARDVLEHPKDDYTKTLLKAVPRL